MTYEEMVEIITKNAAKVPSGEILGHIAVQLNIEGEAEGAFYVEFNNGKVTVAPYEYFDRDILIVCSAEQAIGMSEVKYDPVKGFKNGEIYVEGNLGRLELLKEMLVKSRKINKKKAEARKKTEAGRKTETGKKTEAKKKTAAKKKAETKKKETE